jgi:hypothetical protein
MGKKPEGHARHLCALIGCEGLEELRELVGVPRFICARCGRAARKKKNLCKPRKL